VPSPNPQRSSAAAAGADKLPQAIGGPGLRLAALAGDPAAAYEVGVRFTEGRTVPVNNEEAARWFEIAAKRGLAPAQFRLGSLYEKGLGVKKDLAAARDFYRAAADKGHAKAMHNLAVLYAEGGVDGKADYQTAAQWFRKAADHGVTDSQYNLAVLYARGVGVAQNLTEAYKWFFLAAKEGDQDSAQKRDDIASRLDPQTLASARAAAEQWAAQPLAAEANTVKGAWDAPTPPKPKAKSARAATPDTSKVN
jgi:localization factor PodJL